MRVSGVLFAGGLLVGTAAQAATIYWDNGSNVAWNTSGNWSPNAAGGTNASAAPGSADTAVFTSSRFNGTNLVTYVNTNTSVNGIVFNNTGTTTFYTTGSGVALTIGSGGVTMNSGAGWSTLGASNGTLLINLSASQTWTNNSSAGSLFGQGTYNYNGGGTATWTLGGTGNTAISATVGDSSGTLNIQKTGTGTLTLSGAGNTYAGDTSVKEGTLVLSKSSGNATGAGAVTVGDSSGSAGSALLRLDGNNQINDSSAVTINSDGKLDVNGKTETIGSLAGVGATDLGSGALTAGGNNTTTTYSGVMTGTGTFTKTGTGTTTLSGNNTYTGATNVNGGTLVVSNQTDSATFHIASGAVAEFNVASGSRDNATNTTFDGAGTLRKTGTGTLLWGSKVATFAMDSGSLIDVQGGTLQIGSGSGVSAESWTNNLSDLNIASGATVYGGATQVRVDAITGSGTIQYGWDAATSFTFGVDNGTGTFSGTIIDYDSTHNSTFIKEGTGTQTFSGSSSNTYTGGTFVNNGELDLNKSGNGANDATGTGTLTIGDGVGSANSAIVKDLQSGQVNNLARVVVNSDGQFNINGFTETVGSLAGSGNVTLGSTGILNTGGNNASTTFSGVITGGGTVTKQGTGTMTLSNNNTYTGATTVSAGTLALTATTNTLSTSTDVTVSSGATLSLATSTSQMLHSLAGAGTVTVGSGANLTIDTTSTAFTGTLNLNGATLTLDGTSLGNGMTLNVTGNSVIDFSGNSTLSLASLNLAAGATLQIKNWVAGQDFFFDSGTVNGSSINTISSGTGTLGSINFDGYTNSTGAGGTPTGWRSWSTPGNQISPVPEPSIYGAMLLGVGVAFVGFRRRQRQVL